METILEFEQPILNLEKRLKDLQELAKSENVDLSREIALLEKKVNQMIDDTFSKLSPWQKVQLSRHPNRPYTRDYVDLLFPDFMELQGDRAFGDDQAILGGIATWEKRPVMIIGHQKGRTTKQKMERNFGMAKPEGYRKAMRLMKLAERSKMPIITLIDTPGAYPGIEAEERGQSQAIAESIELMFQLKTPIIALVIGEGGSGGALAIGIADAILMQEYSIYSVISPESCASILWSNSGLAEKASEKLKMSPHELLKLGVIDGIIPEPRGGAQRDWNLSATLIKQSIQKYLEPLCKTSKKAHSRLPTERVDKFRKIDRIALAHSTPSVSSTSTP